MPCLLLVLGLVFPRVALVLLAVFKHWFPGTFGNWLIPVLGFIFLPYTLLWWTCVANIFGGHWGFWQVLFLVVGLMTDLSSYGGAHRRWRR